MDLPGCMGDAPDRLADSARHRRFEYAYLRPSRQLTHYRLGEHTSGHVLEVM